MDEQDDNTFQEDWPEDHRSGVIAVVGRPNAGKSTLINRILGQKIAIVTNKPQTTRKRQLGIYTRPDMQALLVDTPGLHKPHNKLGDYMVSVAEDAIKDADVILWVLDASTPPQEAEQQIAERLRTIKGETPVVLALNKADLLPNAPDLSAHHAVIEHTHSAAISALNGAGVSELLDHLTGYLPHGPRYYPADQVSEVNMRFIAAEIIREAIIEKTEQEIPYAVAVEIEEYKERSADLTYVSAVIHVERDSQKGIIVGKGGAMIKAIGTRARRELANVTGTKIYLDLHAKVLKDWRTNERFLKRVGYRMPRK
ncbi:MAG: GTPase Era [Anaerolineaceae bacterium]|nr:MAG: GTPase Era [Anaerolineaceae bacterium]